MHRLGAERDRGRADRYRLDEAEHAAALLVAAGRALHVVAQERSDLRVIEVLGGGQRDEQTTRDVVSYPVTANRDGKTRVVVQYESDAIVDSHYIYRQLETVKYQYSCFFASYFRDGVPTLPPRTC